MATTRTSTLKGLSNQGMYASGAEALIWVTENILDVSLVNQTATDINQMIALSAGHYAMLVGLQVLTKAGATCLVDVGDGTNDDAFIDSADCNTGTVPVRYSSALTISTLSTDPVVAVPVANQNQLFGLPGGKLYTADDTIDAVFDNTVTAGKIRLTAMVINLDAQATTT